MYYIRRGGRIKGPMNREKLRSLRQERRLQKRDEIAESPDGPWRPLREVYDEVLGGDPFDAVDQGFWRAHTAAEMLEEQAESVTAELDPAWGESLRTWIEGDDLFREPVSPWKLALGLLLIAVLAMFAVTIFLGTQ